MRKAAVKNILVVCTGNMCRSPMAEGFLKAGIEHWDGFIVHSSGTSAVNGLNPTPEAVQVMKEKEIDIAAYTSTPMAEKELKNSDLILVMSRVHRNLIIDDFPEIKNRVFLYKEYADMDKGNHDIADPIGQPMEVYRIVRDEIGCASERIIKKLRNS